MPPVAERVFFQEGTVLVTNARFVAGHQTFALSNVTSVRIAADKHQEQMMFNVVFFPALAAAIGAGIRFGSCGTSVALVALGMIAAAIVMKAFPKYVVILVTAGGESTALQNLALDVAERILAATSSAIVARG